MNTLESNSVVKGGKTIYGAAVGILMLETRFPRIPGDIGHANTWPFPVLYKVVRGATADKVVRRDARGLLNQFIEAAKELVADGADGITTNCGFLSLFQDELSAAVRVPVATSSLLQVPLIQRLLPRDKKVAILTISKATLSTEHLNAAGVPHTTAIAGTDAGLEFTRVILDDEIELDVAKARNDLLDAGRQLMQDHPDTGAIVLECTNMVPYAADLQAALDIPIYSIYSFISWFQAGLAPRRF